MPILTPIIGGAPPSPKISSFSLRTLFSPQKMETALGGHFAIYLLMGVTYQKMPLIKVDQKLIVHNKKRVGACRTPHGGQKTELFGVQMVPF